MPLHRADLHVVLDLHETDEGLFGLVTFQDGRVWILHGRRIADATAEAAVERAMTTEDVDRLLAVGVIDQACAARQSVRVLR